MPASRPSSPPYTRPASKRPSATRKTTIPNRPTLSEPPLNHQLATPGSPKTRSANLGFEIRGFSHPRNHESSAPPSTPGLPPSPNPHPKPPRSNYQTDPISPNPSKSESYGHLPLAESRISPRPRQSKTTVARSSKRPAAFPGLPSDESPAPAELRRSDTSNSLGREPQDHRPKTVSPGRGGTPPFTTNTAHRAAESTAGIHSTETPPPRPPCHEIPLPPNQQHTPKTPQNT